MTFEEHEVLLSTYNSLGLQVNSMTFEKLRQRVKVGSRIFEIQLHIFQA